MSDDFPRQIDKKFLTIVQRIRICLGERVKIKIRNDNIYADWCKTHKIYYIDRQHTNEEIRCPDCDKKWLQEHRGK